MIILTILVTDPSILTNLIIQSILTFMMTILTISMTNYTDSHLGQPDRYYEHHINYPADNPNHPNHPPEVLLLLFCCC